MSECTYSSLARLVLFMICLSVAGTFVAGIHYYAIDLPQQRNQPPQNNDARWECYDQCLMEFGSCKFWGTEIQYICQQLRDECESDCRHIHGNT